MCAINADPSTELRPSFEKTCESHLGGIPCSGLGEAVDATNPPEALKPSIALRGLELEEPAGDVSIFQRIVAYRATVGRTARDRDPCGWIEANQAHAHVARV